MKSIPNKKLATSIGKWLLLAFIFGISYTQSILYTDNQNHKFLYGLADAGLGFLKDDWLANTIDPHPVFSFLVSVTYLNLHEYLFYFYYILIFGIYINSILGISSSIYDINNSKTKHLIFFTIILAIHSESLGYSVSNLHRGMAVQEIIGDYFQPSVFGVFIFLSIYVFLRGKIFWAIVFLSLSVIVHPVYIFSAAVLTFSYMFIIYKESKNTKRSLLLGILSFILILPIILYYYVYLSSTSPEIWQNSLDILVNKRIPHHCIPQVWLKNRTSPYTQTLIIIIALYLIRKTKLFPIIFLPFITAIVLTFAQMVSGSNYLAFLTPWRVSVFLVPISTIITIAYIVTNLYGKFSHKISDKQKIINLFCLLTIFILFIGGINKQVREYFKYYADDTIPMMNFVKKTKASGEVYLIPPKQTKFMKFRLYTGAPIFVDWKSHPLKDVEVIEWYNRNLIAQKFYDSNDLKSCRILNDLSTRYGVTHFVLEVKQPEHPCEFIEEKYNDGKYTVYTIKTNNPGKIF